MIVAFITENLTFFFKSVLAILVIVDPFAVVPIFLSITEKLSQAERAYEAKKACMIATGILLLFVFFGVKIFGLFGISLSAFQIAGGILLLLLGIAQLQAERRRVRPEEKSESMEKEDISVFPLATPLLAGPGAISTVVLLASQTRAVSGGLMIISLATVVALVICFFSLKFATYLHRLLGRTGLNLITRLMGMMLTAIAVQFIINGVTGAINQFLMLSASS